MFTETELSINGAPVDFGSEHKLSPAHAHLHPTTRQHTDNKIKQIAIFRIYSYSPKSCCTLCYSADSVKKVKIFLSSYPCAATNNMNAKHPAAKGVIADRTPTNGDKTNSQSTRSKAKGYANPSQGSQ